MSEKQKMNLQQCVTCLQDDDHPTHPIILTRWSVVHFLWGMLFGRKLRAVNMSWLILGHIIFEIIENLAYTIGVFNRIFNTNWLGDSALNTNADTIAFSVGIVLSRLIK